MSFERWSFPFPGSSTDLRHVWTPRVAQEESSDRGSAWSGLTCVRPFLRLTCRGPGWEFADQAPIKSTGSRHSFPSWFVRSRLVDRCAIPLLRSSHAPTAPQPRALTPRLEPD